MSTGIDLYKTGKVVKDGVDLYVPGSLTYESFHADLTTPNILLFGRRGTRKSWSVRWHLHRLALQYPGFQYMVCRLSKPELQRTHLQFLDADMKALNGVWARTDGETQYDSGSVGIWTGFEKESDALKTLGMTLDVLVIEEITTMQWSVVVDLASCLRTTVESGRIAQLIAPTNPYGPYAGPVKRHWITKDLTQDEEPGYDPNDWRAIPTTAADNPHLDFKSYDKRLGPLQAQKRKAWLLGEWSSSEGTFFEDFKPTRSPSGGLPGSTDAGATGQQQTDDEPQPEQPWHVISRLPELHNRSIYRHPSVPVYRALDWGFADDPAVCLWIAILSDSRAIVIKEMTWKRTPAIEVAHEITGHSRDMNIVGTFADPTMWNGQRHGAQSVADIFEANGVPLIASVNDRRLYSVHEYLTTEIDDLPKIQFWQEGCPMLIRTIPEQRGNKIDPERMADSKTDHYVLALSYFTSGGVVGHEPVAALTIPRWMQPVADEQRVLGAESVRSSNR